MARRRSEPKPPPIPVHPAVEALFDRREKLEEKLRDLETESLSLAFKLVMENQAKVTDFADRIENRGSPYQEGELVIGLFWECPGPLGRCVYDDIEDSCHDSCLFCNQPEERK